MAIRALQTGVTPSNPILITKL
uniref:Uncharacterized protein n=1 Tax=Arundo donax TaxID=35708 RepID=A0A0A9GXP8_ARUDO